MYSIVNILLIYLAVCSQDFQHALNLYTGATILYSYCCIATNFIDGLCYDHLGDYNCFISNSIGRFLNFVECACHSTLYDSDEIDTQDIII